MSRVETADLEQIVLTVEREYDRLTGGHERFRLGRFHRLAFFALRVVTYSIPIALGLLLLGITLLGWGGSLQALLLLAWLLVAILLLLPSLVLLNLPLIVAAWRQRRPIVSRDLLVPVLPAWQLKARWVVLGLTVVAAVLAVTVEAFGWWGFLLMLAVVVFPFALLMLQSFLRLVERNLALLRSVDELRGVLAEKIEEARNSEKGEVDLPHKVAVELSETSQGFLRNERLRAIDDSMRSPSSQFSVLQSAAFRERLPGLEAVLRLQLLDHAYRLGSDWRPGGARHDEASGRWIWPLAELSFEIVYEIAEERRQILVHDARPITPAGEADANGPG